MNFTPVNLIGLSVLYLGLTELHLRLVKIHKCDSCVKAVVLVEFRYSVLVMPFFGYDRLWSYTTRWGNLSHTLPSPSELVLYGLLQT